MFRIVKIIKNKNSKKKRIKYKIVKKWNTMAFFSVNSRKTKSIEIKMCKINPIKGSVYREFPKIKVTQLRSNDKTPFFYSFISKNMSLL